MIEVKKHGIILQETVLDFENAGVLNPATIREGDFVHMFYRAVSESNYSSIGYCKLMGPLEIEERMKTPLLSPEFEYESRRGNTNFSLIKHQKWYIEVDNNGKKHTFQKKISHGEIDDALWKTINHYYKLLKEK